MTTTVATRPRRPAPDGRALLELTPPSGSAQWLDDVRSAALGWARERGFPTRKHEDWRYTRLDPILSLPFEIAPHNPTSAENDTAASPIGAQGARLVFVNGHFDKTRSSVGQLPPGATVTNLASELSDGGEAVRELFSRVPGAEHDAFRALNAALFVDGAFVSLAPGTVVEDPIELEFVTATGEAPVVFCPRSVVLAGEGASATIVEIHRGEAASVGLANAVTEVELGPGAHIEHYVVQDEPSGTFHLGLVAVNQARDSEYRSHVVALGAAIGRHDLQVHLDDVGAEAHLDGLYLVDGTQVIDNPVLVEHAAPGCTSTQLYKGVVAGNGHGVFNGHIVVRPHADGTDARQTNKNLLLSDNAEVDTRPRLEILADDVKCAHGAAVGRLDDDAVFYLRTRGVPEAAARALLTYAFVEEMVERIDEPALRDKVAAALLERMTAFGSGVTEIVEDTGEES